MPIAEHADRNEEGAVVQLGLDRRQQHHVAASTTSRPARTESACREPRGQGGAGDRGEEEPGRGGKHVHAGFERVEALDDLQVERDREEDPHQDQVLSEQHRDPAAQRADAAAAARWTRGSRPCSSRRRSQTRSRPGPAPPRRSRTGSARSRTARSASCAAPASPSCSPAGRRRRPGQGPRRRARCRPSRVRARAPHAPARGSAASPPGCRSPPRPRRRRPAAR